MLFSIFLSASVVFVILAMLWVSIKTYELSQVIQQIKNDVDVLSKKMEWTIHDINARLKQK